MNTKVSHIVVGFVCMGMVFSAFVFSGHLSHPETSLLGTWKEVSWTYEKVDLPEKRDTSSDGFLEEQLKNEISKDLIIHKSEYWTFDREAGLRLSKKGAADQNLNWRLKGRGHILKIKHDDSIHEVYQIKELSDKKLVLHFENDMHARGIVRIEFEKIGE